MTPELWIIAFLSWAQVLVLVIIAGNLLHPLWKSYTQLSGENYDDQFKL